QAGRPAPGAGDRGRVAVGEASRGACRGLLVANALRGRPLRPGEGAAEHGPGAPGADEAAGIEPEALPGGDQAARAGAQAPEAGTVAVPAGAGHGERGRGRPQGTGHEGDGAAAGGGELTRRHGLSLTPKQSGCTGAPSVRDVALGEGLLQPL